MMPRPFAVGPLYWFGRTLWVLSVLIVIAAMCFLASANRSSPPVLSPQVPPDRQGAPEKAVSFSGEL